MKDKKFFITGVNGFIGSMLAEKLLGQGYKVAGIDPETFNIKHLLKNKKFSFMKARLENSHGLVEKQIKAAGIIIPLAAVATPVDYIRNPLKVFELDFEENLFIVKMCVKHKKRIIFPSTSEVYGMCGDASFNEDTSKFILGPTKNQRWIYSCCKQLLERIIWAHGKESGLRFTVFRPFNWVGPRLDSLKGARSKSSRVITLFISNIVNGEPLLLVDGGGQRRSFTDISDGVGCLLKIIENKNSVCDGEIFNIGNPGNEMNIKELAEKLLESFKKHPLRRRFPEPPGIKSVKSGLFYGEGYEDIPHRKPCVKKAEKLFGWKPRTPFSETLEKTLDYFLKKARPR